MIGPIVRVRRLIARRPLVPMMMLVVGVSAPTDPTRRATGYGGVLPVPGPSATATASTPRLDSSIDQQRRDLRAARGRVLYAPGRGPHDTASVHNTREHKPPCPTERVGQGRVVSPAPTS